MMLQKEKNKPQKENISFTIFVTADAAIIWIPVSWGAIDVPPHPKKGQISALRSLQPDSEALSILKWGIAWSLPASKLLWFPLGAATQCPELPWGCCPPARASQQERALEKGSCACVKGAQYQLLHRLHPDYPKTFSNLFCRILKILFWHCVREWQAQR